MVLATAVPANAPMKLNAVAMRIAWLRAQGARRDRRRDGVRRVVESVDVVEDDREGDDDEQAEGDAFHGGLGDLLSGRELTAGDAEG